MKSVSFSFFISLLFIGILNSQPAISFDKVFEDFTSIEINFNQCAEVNNYTIKKDAGIFTLKSGKVYLTTPINNVVRAVVFVGDGNFKFTPPTEVEKKHLFRFYEKESLDENFQNLVFLFGDNTLEELKASLEFKAENNEKPKVNINDILSKFLVYKDEEYFPPDFAKTFLDNEMNKLFFAAFKDNNNKPIFFKVNPFDYEDIELLKSYNNLFRKDLEIVCKFPSRNAFPDKKDKKLFHISKFDIDSKIDDSYSMDFSGTTSVKLKPEYGNQYWIPFNVFSEMEIDSVLLDNKKVEFSKSKNNPIFWVKSNDPLMTNKDYNFQFFYKGDLLYRTTSAWILLHSIHDWYVNTYWENVADYSIKFTFPQKWQIICVGDKLSDKEIDENYKEIIWTGKNFKSASFSIGKYKDFNFNLPDIAKISVYQNTVSFGNYDMEKQVGADIVNSISFFNDVFGPMPFKNINVTDMPIFHGEAFPGFIHLSFSTFLENGYDGSEEAFRAHEVAHQWWGISVGYNTYHDQWLSEGFATYSGLWFMQATLRDNDKFMDMLDNYKEEIMSNRNYLFSKGQQAGPIWLGYRTNSSETEGDYNLIIYKKGAWVLHMLRMMLLDLKTMNEDLFKNMMKDYYNSYKGKKANTEDFIKIVNKHFGEDMTWFFNQYVYNVEIPEYEFSYKTEITDGGKYQVYCKMKQNNVPPDFKMYIPILVKFDNDQFARLRIFANGSNAIVKLPLLPLEPEEIIFNDLNSVLCEVDYTEWSE